MRSRGRGASPIYATSNGEWRSYAGDIGGQKFSSLDQIDAGNFADLEPVDNRVSKTTPAGGEWAPLDAVVEAFVAQTHNLYRTGHLRNATGFQATQLMVGLSAAIVERRAASS